MIYCLKCKKKTEDTHISHKKAKNGRMMMIAKCDKCGTLKHQFVANDQKGGNPALISAAVQAIPGAIGGISDAVDKGRRTQHEFNKDNGALAKEKSANFQQFYRDLMHTRYWDGEKLPPKLRFPREKTNNPKYASEQEAKDDALYEYAEKQWEKMMK